MAQEQRSDKKPSPHEVREFWSGIWSNPIEHRPAGWIFKEYQCGATIKTMLDWQTAKERRKKYFIENQELESSRTG